MSTIRVIGTKNPTIESDFFVRDGRISLKAKGLLLQMHAYPFSDDFSIEDIARYGNDSEGTIRTTIKELEKTGYIDRRQGRDESGKMLPVEYVLFENPYEGLIMTKLKNSEITQIHEEYSATTENDHNDSDFSDTEDNPANLILELIVDMLDNLFTICLSKETHSFPLHSPCQGKRGDFFHR